MLDAKDSFTHQNSLLLIAESLQVNKYKKQTKKQNKKSHSAPQKKKSAWAYIYIKKKKKKEALHICAYLRVISQDVIKARQQAQAGADLYVHGSVHVVEEIKSLVDQLTSFLQETWGQYND